MVIEGKRSHVVAHLDLSILSISALGPSGSSFVQGLGVGLGVAVVAVAGVVVALIVRRRLIFFTMFCLLTEY